MCDQPFFLFFGGAVYLDGVKKFFSLENFNSFQVNFVRGEKMDEWKFMERGKAIVN